MKTVNVTWQPDAARFEALGGHPGRAIVINAPHEGPATGFSASELLLAGAGACSAWDVIQILRKQRQQVTAVTVGVEGDQAEVPPWPYEAIRLHFTVTGHGLDGSKVRKAVELSERRYCAVIATVRGVAEVSCRVEVVEAGAEDTLRETSAPVVPDGTA